MTEPQIPLYRPDIGEREIKYVNKSLNTLHLSLEPHLLEFERKFAEFARTKYAIAVNSGTSGLHLCIKAAGIEAGDQVITTPFGFVASSNCILSENAVPVFIDIDPLTLNIDPQKMEDYLYYQSESTISKIKAILPVHVFGCPCDMDPVMSVARKYNFAVIEDACESIGAEYNLTQAADTSSEWRRVGGIGKMGVFAFYSNRQMTAGEGGMIVTDCPEIAGSCREMRNHGRKELGGWLAHETLGYNYRLSDLNCALGIAQLERLDEILDKRHKVAEMYNQRLQNFELIRLPHENKKMKRSWSVYVVRLIYSFTGENRDNILKKLQEKGIGCNCYFPPIHLQPLYLKRFTYKKGDFPITEGISERTIALPFYNDLTEMEIDYICSSFKEIVEGEFKKRRNGVNLSLL